MLERVLLNILTDDTFKSKIDNLSRNCLRGTSERFKCEKCIELCPENAIEKLRAGISVDPLLCGGCNLCVSSCYARTFSAPNKPYLAAINKIVEGEKTNWGCMKTKENSDVSFGCIRTLDPRFLFALAFSDLEQKINFDLSHCEGCQYENIGWDFKSLTEFVEGNANLEKLQFHEGFTSDKEEINLSRRDFLRSILKDTKSISKSAIKETSKSLGYDLETKEDIDPLIKILLQRGISENRDTQWMKEHIYEVSVDSNCTFCYECVSYCPTKALSIEESPGEQSIKVDMDLCNFCGRCLEKCRFSAISKNTFTSMGTKVLYRKEKEKCKSCRVSSTNLNEEGLCPTCEIRNRNKRKF